MVVGGAGLRPLALAPVLETSNVVRFALLFGTTWFVNALVFAGILVSVSLAIEVARRVRFRRPALLYAPLFAAVALAWVIPPESLLGLDFVPRFAAAVALGFTPVFIANLVFADRFRDVGSSGIAFGTNLLGAIVGGVLEYGALVTGYRALLIVVAALYAPSRSSGVAPISSRGMSARSSSGAQNPRRRRRAPAGPAAWVRARPCGCAGSRPRAGRGPTRFRGTRASRRRRGSTRADEGRPSRRGTR